MKPEPKTEDSTKKDSEISKEMKTFRENLGFQLRKVRVKL
jgi:hypothetical protein